MPVNSANQGIPEQQGADPANLPSAQVSWDGVMENRLAQRYTSIADRTARNPAPNENELAALADVDRVEIFDTANWVSLHHRALYCDIRKPTDETINNVAVDQADDALTIAVAANGGTFQFRIQFFYSTSTAADLRCRLNAPAGTVGRIGVNGIAGAGATDVSATSVTIESGTDLVVGGLGVGTANALMAVLAGEVTIGANAGSLTFNWAQNAADPTNTVVYARSLFQVWRVA